MVPAKCWKAPESSCKVHVTEQYVAASYLPVTRLPNISPVKLADEIPLRLPESSNLSRPTPATGRVDPPIVVVPVKERP
jgi:hypothetical protein